MSDLIERVARAIYGTHVDAFPEHRKTYFAVARSAVEAMREPTNVMLKASCGAMSESKRPTPDRVSSKEKHRIRYRAMIDAELSKQTFAEATAVTNGNQ